MICIIFLHNIIIMNLHSMLSLYILCYILFSKIEKIIEIQFYRIVFEKHLTHVGNFFSFFHNIINNIAVNQVAQ